METTNSSDNDSAERIKDLVARLRYEYRDDPNVQTVGWGLPRRGDTLADEISIIFHVKSKLAGDRSIAAAGSTPIPAEIEGFPTDVQAVQLRPVSDMMGQRDETKFDPLRGGVASGNSENHIVWFNGSGTLGVLGRDNADGSAIGLSNWHVWGDGGEEGDQIIQPGHPSGGDHAEAVGKVLACGPLLTSLIEWEAPDPIAAGLYAGAAAAAIAAAASDYRDPTRRGQDATIPNPGEKTLRETVDMQIEYPELPLPGVPFTTNVTWRYQRETENQLLTHEVTETRVNTQFLLGKLVATNKAHYQPGEDVQLVAAIWDYQPRPCDGYHVVAHLIPHARPATAFRAVMHPTACPRTFPHDPPEGEEPTTRRCLDFDEYKVSDYPWAGNFAWLGYANPGQDPVHVVEWFDPERGLQIPQETIIFQHAPASAVHLRIVTFHTSLVTAIATNAAGAVVDQVTVPNGQAVPHTVSLSGEGIVRVTLRGGAGEAVLLEYCIEAVGEDKFSVTVGEPIAAGIRAENPEFSVSARQLASRRCCFAGSVRLPPDEDPGKWDVHLTVQNVNHVPDGTDPEKAATVIGGHVLSEHASAQVLGCTVIMLLDHAFDVI